jgi:MerR family redox-sensitive transcriptional activator SoxR
MNAGLTIGEVSRRAGLRPSALRYYESLGLLEVPTREGRFRRYDTTVFQRLQVIQLAQQAGFTMAEIAELLNGFASDTPPAVRWRAFAERKLAAVDAQIRRAQEMRRLLEESLRCGCLTLEECVSPLQEGRPEGFNCATGCDGGAVD